MAEAGELAGRLDVTQWRRGAYLFRRGDAGDSLYVVVSGQVALELPGADGPRVLELCGPGDWFGELGLLALGPRTADARVAVDATLLRIDREAWAELSRAAPWLFARLCERLGARLRERNASAPPAPHAVIACGDAEEPCPPWLPALAQSLRRQFPGRPVHTLAADGTPIAGPDMPPAPRRDDGALQQALARLVASDAVVLVAGDGLGDLADRQLRRLGPAEWTLEPGSGGAGSSWIRGASVEEALDRAARHVARGTVGLALGSGGAFGFAHLGLLAALGSAGIPVDFVAGTSMGAIIGGMFAAGLSPARGIEFSHGLASRYRTLILGDLDLRGGSLLKGSGVMQLLAEVREARAATFGNLMLPFAAIATDIATGEEIVLDSGALLDGIRPSFAMPGIFPPCAVGTRLLIDGAMVNPVPVDRARALGADVVIASQPIPPLQPEAADPLAAFLSRVQGLASRIPIPRLGLGMRTLTVSLRSYQALWYRLAVASAHRADASVSPDLHAFWFLQFGDAARIIDAGREAAQAAVPAIRAMLRQRIGLGGP
jgi:NTE family protein